MGRKSKTPYELKLAAVEAYSITYLCKKLNVSISAYYKWINLKSSNGQIANELLAEQITDMYNESNGGYGSKMMKIQMQHRYFIGTEDFDIQARLLNTNFSRHI